MNKDQLLITLAGGVLLLLGVFSFRQINRKKNSQLNSVPGRNQQLVSSSQKESAMPASISANKSLNQPEMQLDPEKQYQAVLETDLGNITIELQAQATPITVNNFVYLAKQGFYDGTIFHRVMNGFMIQGGDPRGDGTGGPGYRFADEDFDGEYSRGTVAMANAGPDTNGSQFFIMHQDYPLPANYVIFGQVVNGMEVVDQIATAPVETSLSGEPSKPVNPVTVKNITINND